MEKRYVLRDKISGLYLEAVDLFEDMSPYLVNHKAHKVSFVRWKYAAKCTESALEAITGAVLMKKHFPSFDWQMVEL